MASPGDTGIARAPGCFQDMLQQIASKQSPHAKPEMHIRYKPKDYKQNSA